MSTIVAIDTETTGLGHKADPKRDDAIIQVGIAWRGAKDKLLTWGSLCLPDKRYLLDGRAARALEVNKLKLSDVLKAQKDGIVATTLKMKLKSIGKVELRAYNVSFDGPFLMKKPWWIPKSAWGPCIMRSTSNHFDLGYGNMKLEEALSEFGLKKPKGSFHNAETDAAAALLIDEALRRIREDR